MIQTDQLRLLERMSESMPGPELDIRVPEGNADLLAGYLCPTTSTHPMDSRLFGEGRDTIDMMIVRVAGDDTADMAA